MEALAWIVVTPALIMLVLYGASRVRFTGRHSGSGLGGAFTVIDQFYQPAALEARIALEEEQRHIVQAPRDQAKDPVTGTGTSSG